MLKRITGAAVCFILSGIIALALLCPNQSRVKYTTDDTPIKTLSLADITQYNMCNITQNGEINVTGSDAYIVFENVGSVRFLQINTQRSPKTPVQVQVFYTKSGESYAEQDSVLTGSFSGDNTIGAVIPSGVYDNLRIDFSGDFTFSNIQIYDTVPTVTTQKIQINPLRYVLVVLIAVLAAALFVFLDVRFNFKFKKPSFNKNVGKILAEHPEKIFLGLVIALGALMVIAQPFAHNSWDVDSHYKWALNASFVGNANVTAADKRVCFNEDAFFPESATLQNDKLKAEFNELDKTVIYSQPTDTTVAHILSGVFIAVGRLFGASFTTKFALGQFANVLIYGIVCYFGMKRLRDGKMIFATIALFPTNLFLAANYSYDYWVVAFSLLGMAYFIGELQREKERVTLKNAIIMCSALVLACLPKLIYAPLLLVPFFLNKKGFKGKDKKAYYSVCVSALLLLFVLLAAKSLTTVSGTGDLRGGSDVSPSGQIMYILSNPIEYAKTLLLFLRDYLSVSGMKGYIVNFAYLGMGSLSGVFVILMILTALTDRYQCETATNWWLRALSLILYFGMAAVIATSLYIAFTGVGKTDIAGCQPRYIIPLIYPVLALIGAKKINLKINKTVYNGVILIACAAVNVFNVLTVF